MSHWRSASLSLTPASLARAANAWRKDEERDTFGSTSVEGGFGPQRHTLWLGRPTGACGKTRPSERSNLALPIMASISPP